MLQVVCIQVGSRRVVANALAGQGITEENPAMKDKRKGMKSVLLRVYSVLWLDSRMRSMDAYKGSFFST